MLSHLSLFAYMEVRDCVYNVCMCECFCVINGLEVAGDAAVMLDYMEGQASLLHLMDHIREKLAHSCQFSASVHLLLKVVCV